MKIEVGKIYKCGNELVKIVHYYDSPNTNYKLLGVKAKKDGDYADDTVAAGRFHPSGDYSICNTEELCNGLEELSKTVKEMTMEQVNEALGFVAKIVEKV